MHEPRRTIRRCLAASSVSLLFALLATTFGAQAASAETSSAQGVPDIALIVSAVVDDATIEDLRSELGEIDGVARVTSDVVSEDETVFYLVRNDGVGRPVDLVARQAERIITAASPQSEVLTGGSAIADAALADRYRTTAEGVVFVAAVIGMLFGLVFGWRRGLLSAAGMAFTVATGAAIGSQAGGTFDGTLATTAVPGALAALIVATVVAVRLLVWFRAPIGSDGAQLIRNSLGDLVAEFALVFAGLAVAAVLVELLDPGRSPLTVICISALVSAVIAGTVLASALALLPPEPGDGALAIPVSIPDGRDLSLLILSAVAFGLAVLSIFALRQPEATLLDVGRLGDDDEPALVASKLAVAGGDATTAVLAFQPDNVDDATFEQWAMTVVERTEIESVDLASGRLRATGPVDVSETTLLVVQPSSEAASSAAAGVAVVVLNVSPRSEAGQQAVAILATPSLLGDAPTLGGFGVDAADRAGSRSTIVVAVIALAIVAGLAIQILTQSRSQAAVGFGLRLLGGGATVGIYRLMAPGATVAETLTVLGLVSLGAGLLQLEFVALGRHGYSGSDAGPNPGQYAAFGLTALALAGLFISVAGLFSGGPDTGRLSLGLLAVVVVELLTGAFVLTPALLGQRGAFHTVVRPVRIALHSSTEGPVDGQTSQTDPTWRRTIEDLIQAEFRLQSEPAIAELDTVFVTDTPLYRQAATHHENLGRADLRIVGRRPRLRSVKSVGGRSPVSLAITVDHPERQLMARDGTIVGVRKAERRSGVLWLSEAIDGTFRIAESVELGSVPLPDEHDSESLGSKPAVEPEILLDGQRDPAGQRDTADQ